MTIRLSGLGAGGAREWTEKETKETIVINTLRLRTYANKKTGETSPVVPWMYRISMTEAQEQAITAILEGKLPTQPIEEWGTTEPVKTTTNGYPIVTRSITTPWAGILNGGGAYAWCCAIARDLGMEIPTQEESMARRAERFASSQAAPHTETPDAGSRDVAF